MAQRQVVNWSKWSILNYSLAGERVSGDEPLVECAKHTSPGSPTPSVWIKSSATRDTNKELYSLATSRSFRLCVKLLQSCLFIRMGNGQEILSNESVPALRWGFPWLHHELAHPCTPRTQLHGSLSCSLLARPPARPGH